MTLPAVAAGPHGHVVVVHEQPRRAEDLEALLRAAGHRVSAPAPGRAVVQAVVECAPDVVLVSDALADPATAAVVRGVRHALGADVRILVLYGGRLDGAPAEADDVVRDDPASARELPVRIARLVLELADKRALQRKASDLLGLYKMSWAFSLAGGAEALFGHLARHSAEMLKATRGLVLLYDHERRQLMGRPPGFGLSPEEVERVRYPVDAEAASRWNFRRNGPLLSNKAQADSRLLPWFVRELRVQSVLIAPITRGPEILGLLGVADRTTGAPFNEDDLNLLMALAGQATVAVENLRLHEELKRANTLLQEYDRLKSEFVGIVAHDFRKPLMAIRGFAELVLEEPELAAETRAEFMKTVVSETDHLARLANDTLLITQIETGQLHYSFREIEIGPFLLEAVPLGLSEHSVLMDVPPALPRIWADPDRLRQVIGNLVSNAIKYSPTGGSVAIRVRERGTGQIVIEVEDHGLGIPPEHVGKLFQKFSRVRTEDHLKVPGTGLGLYICRLILEGHGGQIWVESEVGRGSTFGITLPIDARDVADGPPTPAGDQKALTPELGTRSVKPRPGR